ncbi:non-ribosomal peptide synthetase/MFS transporter [Microtetraspora niveoalba]|uniref:non-ribosomal peptide synthetase/MFS transporter n=1 Tax=Microtetraspora niveoalba TaxID=46175 RepID=UPI0008340A09|nr:non-ribosomal peptide synthetase/MFS transporter [Microtetraspora niveoalba]
MLAISDIPLSLGQERLWFLHELNPNDASYNICVTERLRGPLDAVALEHALGAVVRRHEVLRTRYPAVDGSPVQVIDNAVPVLERVAAPSEERAAELVAELTNRPFDLAEGPVIRTRLITLTGPGDSAASTGGETGMEHILVVVLHHIAGDGWSLGVLFRELAAHYRAFLDGTPPRVPDLPMRYADHAIRQRARDRAEEHDSSLAHWKERLAGVPVLALPTDRQRPRTRSSRGGCVAHELPAALTERLTRLARAERVTLFMLLLAGFQTELSRYSGQTDFCVGSPVAARDDEETEHLIGFFLNTLAIRADLSGDPAFRDLLRRTRSTVVEALVHKGTPFDRLVTELGVERDLSRTPVFQTQFSLRSETNDGLDLAGVTAERYDPGFQQAKFDLSLEILPAGDVLKAFFVYSADLFHRETVERFAANFETLLWSVVAAPETPISELELVAPAEREIIAEWSACPAVPEPPAPTLPEMVATTARRFPGTVAVRYGDDALTYAELDARAGTLAARLRALGVGRDVPVGIRLEQSLDQAVAILGVLKAGGAYVPLDPEQPAERLRHMLQGAAVLIAAAEGAGTPGAQDAQGGRVAAGGAALPPEPDFAGPVVDPGGALIRKAAPGAPGTGDADAGDGLTWPPPSPDDLAYVIYTSGSTGRPKGVAVQHRQVMNYLADVHHRFGVTEGGNFALLQSLTFDFGMTVFYLSLMTGGTLHMLPSRVSAPELAASMPGIDYLKMTPSHLAALAADVDARALLPRRLLILGGEGSGWEWARELAALGACRVVNHYGPTEATIGVTTYEVGADTEPAGPITPIGRPLGHARIHVLDARLRPVPVGVPGELCVGGDRLARGYLGRPDLTAAAFVDSERHGRIYRTGDLARWLPDGTLEFLGRHDLQVKIRGYRVELGEVDEALRLCPGVAHAVTDARGGELVAYLVAGDATDRADRPGVAELRRDLGTRLPDYMVPTRYVWLDELPLKGHGKVNRAALPDPEDDRPDQEVPFEPPADEIEEIIAAAWCDVLGIRRVGVLDDFFDLGGHSLLATRVVARLRRELPPGGHPVGLMDLFQRTTVRELAELARSGAGPRGLLYELTAPRRGTVTSTLVCVPYGGGSAVVYQPLADALSETWRLFSVAVPGHDLGLAEEPRPLEEVAQQCVEEITEKVTGPLVLYGHCGVGGALTAEIARRLEAAGREVEAVYMGGVFPFARPVKGLMGRWARLTRLERLRSDRADLNWLTALGADLSDLDDEQKAFVVRNMRHDAREAEDYFTRLIETGADRLSAPIISIVGEYDPATDYYEERYREWEFLTDTTALVVLDEGGHYFLKYRAEELAAAVTATHRDLPAAETPEPAPPAALSTDGRRTGPARTAGPDPTVRRFLTVALGQMACLIGSTLTEFAIPVWMYLRTGSMTQYAVLQILAVIPGILAAPLAGAIVDRSSRRTVMVVGNSAALAIQSAAALLLWAGHLGTWPLYVLLTALSVALTFQRLAFTSAVPQLVPKRYLGHANGVAQTTLGVAQFIAPLAAVGLLSAAGLQGILVLDVVGHVFTLVVLALVAFPATMAHRRRETVGREIAEGFRLSMGNRSFRAMVIFFALLSLGLSPVFMMYSPLVLSFGTLTDAGAIALVAGAGAVSGGLTMAVWGGPARGRMRAMLLTTSLIAASCLVVGLDTSLVLIGVGAFGVSYGLALVNGIYATIIQVKVPQRFHGRVFALNQMVAWSTIPLGVGVIAPLGTRLLGDIGTMYLVFAGFIAAVTFGALRTRVLARFDDEVPDATPDDLVGLERRARKTA